VPTAAAGGRGLLFIGCGSAALNLLSWYAIRRGQAVEPTGFRCGGAAGAAT
jgi:hypothetical protein